MHVQDLLNRLDHVRSNGKDRWTARCPAHQDRGPSLSIRQAEDRILLHCFAGCGAVDVLEAVGLSLSDLFDDRPSERKAAGARLAAVDVARTLNHEALVLMAVLRDLESGIKPDRDRLELAQRTIYGCLDALGGCR